MLVSQSVHSLTVTHLHSALAFSVWLALEGQVLLTGLSRWYRWGLSGKLQQWLNMHPDQIQSTLEAMWHCLFKLWHKTRRYSTQMGLGRALEQVQ